MLALSFLSVAVVGLLFPRTVRAEPRYTTPQLCTQGCYEATCEFTFNDLDPDDTYEGMYCHSVLSVTSIYACYASYCSEYSPSESFGGLNAYCTEYGSSPLSMSYDEAMKYIEENYGSVSNVTVLDPRLILPTTVVNNTVITPKDYTGLSIKTVTIWQHQMYVHHSFGWAMYVLASGVIIVGVANRLFAFIVHTAMKRSGPLLDVEGVKGAKPVVSNRGVFTKVKNLWAKYITLPATFGYRHIQPWAFCTIPTRLQSILVFVYVALNFIFCCIDYNTFDGNTYWTMPASQLSRYMADRTGIISYANLPLIWLFAGRNDVLLWLTGWSYSTFNIFHRYVARVATAQAIAHSVGYTVFCYITYGGNWEEYKEELLEQYFVTGIAATVVMSVLIGLSIFPLRRYFYELFLVTHVTFSLAFLVLLFYHTKIFDGEYDGYLWPCAGFWVFDRFIRLVRIGLLNWRVLNPKDDLLKRNRATAVYDAEGDIIRLTVRPSTNFAVGAGVHYYIYTPTLSFMLWENHPFTLSAWRNLPLPCDAEAGQTLSAAEEIQQVHEQTASGGSDSPIDEKEVSIASKRGAGAVASHSSQQELIFIIRPYKGMTSGLKKQLMKAPGHTKELLVLLEGPYGVKTNLAPYERVLMISGGSGVSGITSYLCEQGAHAPDRHTRFVWAAREESFVSDVVEKDLASFVDRDDVVLDLYLTRGPQVATQDRKTGVEATLRRLSSRVGAANGPKVTYAKPNVAELLDNEIGQLLTKDSRLAVVVCGPGRLADDVRREVVRSIGSKIDASRIELHEESFGW